MAAASIAFDEQAWGQQPADYKLEIAPYTLELSPKHSVRTIAYNQQVPGPLLRLKEGRTVTIEVTNRSADAEVVHWHGLFLPPAVDGAMEEGTPMIPPGATARYTFEPRPAGFRWYHTHTTAGSDLKKAQYTGLHGFLMIDPTEEPGRYDQEFFLAIHDWDGEMAGSADGSMNPEYRYTTINGRMYGAGDPLRVKRGQRVLFHMLNSSATEVHWLSLSGHEFQVIALDGNPVPRPQSVSMIRLAPAERVCAIVEMNHAGKWVLGEVRKHVQAAGAAMVVEYENATGEAVWQQPEELVWDYSRFAALAQASAVHGSVIDIPLEFTSKFVGHGAPDHWMINGKSYPETSAPLLHEGQRYRLIFKNPTMDDHPVHLHRHSFELRSLPGTGATQGIMKDVVLAPSKSELVVEFVADHPGDTLFHCHQQNHMDYGFMLLFHYA
ncbi:multicopper oxidase family protein [Acidicapsa dinghuensis]|uniref:Multicopper oxidase family protein n=1 Tax=Acidicapsa dinghuensis TaxID=2218256 RepID=A0ABW1EKJ3_9BACT|nr:multicopper oxidase domain-containing protein [Acidicapsa dinghuensis]